MIKEIKGFIRGLWIGVKCDILAIELGSHGRIESLDDLADISGYDDEVQEGIICSMILFPIVTIVTIWEILKLLFKKVKK